LLEQKRSLAEGVVDGTGGREMALPSGRAAFLERMESLMAGKKPARPAPATDPLEQLRDEMLGQWSAHLDLMELHGEGEQQTLLVVADRRDDALQSSLARHLQERFPDRTPQLQLLDREAFATIRQLIDAGVLHANRDTARTLYRTPAADKPKDDRSSKRLTEARDRLAQSEHQRRMAKVLTEGGFAAEALAPMRKAVETAVQALTHWKGHNAGIPPALSLIDSTLVQTKLLPADTLSLLARLREDQPVADDVQADDLLTQSDRLLSQAAALLKSAQVQL